MPPNASYSHVVKLRELVKEEQDMQQKRKDHFFSRQFAMDSPGVLFPGSWSSLAEVTHLPKRVPQGCLFAQVNYQVEELRHICQSTLPIFERSTEDGLAYRIYRVGSVEVRTTQELGEQEAIGAVFSIHFPTLKSSPHRSIKEGEAITKVTEFVEANGVYNARPETHYYVVIETSGGNKLVTELMPSGSVGWCENPDELDDRNSLARVTRTTDSAAAVRVCVVKAHWQGVMQHSKSPASQSMRKQYARNVFKLARGWNNVQQGFDGTATAQSTVNPVHSKATNVTRASMRSAMWRTPFKC
jgi:hypothetical protein